MIKISHPTRKTIGSVKLPASKSLSNRALIIQALCNEPFVIHNLSAAEDTQVLKHILDTKPTVADVGDAGTAMRFLLAYYATQPQEVTLIGSDRMKQRPIGPLVDALRIMGAEINYLEKEGYPPVKVKGGRALKDTVTIKSDISSQFITALMLIAPVLDNGLTILFDGDAISFAYIEMTAHLLEHFGADIEEVDNGFKIIHTKYLNDDFEVEPDWSAASYFFEIAALAMDADITVENLPVISSQGDSAILDLYEAVFDLKCRADDNGIRIRKQKKQLDVDDAEYDFTDIPDMAQTVAATAAGLGMAFTLTGLKTLRIKETDRIAALKVELEKLGVTAEVGNDWIKINPPHTNTGDLQFYTYSDHRMAMSLAPLALMVNTVTIDNEAVVNKSFPGYWDELAKLGFEITTVV